MFPSPPTKLILCPKFQYLNYNEANKPNLSQVRYREKLDELSYRNYFCFHEVDIRPSSNFKNFSCKTLKVDTLALSS